MNPITYPARPIDGGPFDRAPAKTGAWFYQPKVNGWRTLIHAPTGTMWNRYGERLSIEPSFRSALEELHKSGLDWIDAEALDRRHARGRGSLVVLDLPTCGQPAWVRVAFIAQLWQPMRVTPANQASDPAIDHCPGEGLVYAIGTYRDGASLWAQTQQDNAALGIPFYEGIVAKRDASRYPLQLRSPNEKFPYWVKHRWPW